MLGLCKSVIRNPTQVTKCVKRTSLPRARLFSSVLAVTPGRSFTKIHLNTLVRSFAKDVVIKKSDVEEEEEEPEPTLAEMIASELMEEKSNDEVNPDLIEAKKDILKHYKLTDVLGEGRVCLTSEKNGERIKIKINVQEENDYVDESQFEGEEEEYAQKKNFEEEEEEDEELLVSISFSVTIEKGGEKVVFECVANPNSTYDISNVQHFPAGKLENDEDLFAGPKFDQLNEDLQDSFKRYLEERHIDDNMAYFVHAYANDKEQREYVNWLERLGNFIEPDARK